METLRCPSGFPFNAASEEAPAKADESPVPSGDGGTTFRSPVSACAAPGSTGWRFRARSTAFRSTRTPLTKNNFPATTKRPIATIPTNGNMISPKDIETPLRL